MLLAAVFSVLLCFAHSSPLQITFERNIENAGNNIEDDDFSISALLEKANANLGNNIEDDDFSISALLEKANANLGKNLDEPLVLFGDIAVHAGLRNADPCTARGCKWPKSTDGNVYVPYRISNQYSQRERDIIVRALNSFEASTCIRFRPRQTERDFVDIQSRSGCFSFVGRTGGAQVLSLSRQGCVFNQIVQHEFLHALGFNHEQTRSDRDQHVRILLQNVIPGMEHNFRVINTNNLNTPYDYNSVMQYGRTAFSRNRQPTIVPIPNPNVAIGTATQMSANDILRVNRLYECRTRVSKPKRKFVPSYQIFQK